MNLGRISWNVWYSMKIEKPILHQILAQNVRSFAGRQHYRRMVVSYSYFSGCLLEKLETET